MQLMMAAPLLNIMVQYSGPVFSGIVAGLMCRAYYAAQMKNKLKDHQKDFLKSQERIIELEALNERLEKRLKEMESYFSKDHIIMN